MTATGSFTRRRTNNWTENTLKRRKRGRPRGDETVNEASPDPGHRLPCEGFRPYDSAPAPPQRGGAAAHKLTTGPSADSRESSHPRSRTAPRVANKTARALAKSQNRRSRSISQSVKMTGSVQSDASSASRPLTGNIRLS